MRVWCAYGLSIHSELPLPECPPGKGPPDVTVRYGKVRPIPELDESLGRGFWVKGSEACHRMGGVGSFLVRSGNEIIIDPENEVPQELLRLSVLGPALGIALHQRGHFALHASSVALSGQAVAFIGGHRAGKSTTASLLHSRGHELVTDDVTVLERENGAEMVVPSFPQTKLWSDSVELLGLAAGELPQLHPEFQKFGWRPQTGFADASRPLKRLYVLGSGAAFAVERIQPHEGLGHIMQNWYGARFGPDLLQSLDSQSHFLRCVEIARRVPTRRLVRPVGSENCPPDVSRLEDQILRDLDDLSS